MLYLEVFDNNTLLLSCNAETFAINNVVYGKDLAEYENNIEKVFYISRVLNDMKDLVVISSTDEKDQLFIVNKRNIRVYFYN